MNAVKRLSAWLPCLIMPIGLTTVIATMAWSVRRDYSAEVQVKVAAVRASYWTNEKGELIEKIGKVWLPTTVRVNHQTQTVRYMGFPGWSVSYLTERNGQVWERVEGGGAQKGLGMKLTFERPASPDMSAVYRQVFKT